MRWPTHAPFAVGAGGLQHRAARVLHRGLPENGSVELPVTSRHAVSPGAPVVLV